MPTVNEESETRKLVFGAFEFDEVIKARLRLDPERDYAGSKVSYEIVACRWLGLGFALDGLLVCWLISTLHPREEK